MQGGEQLPLAETRLAADFQVGIVPKRVVEFQRLIDPPGRDGLPRQVEEVDGTQVTLRRRQLGCDCGC